MLFLFLILLLGFIIFIFIQYQKYARANKLYSQARKIDTGVPYDLNKLKEALAVYKQCSKLVNSSTYTKAINDCQHKIDDLLRFQSLLAIGRKKAKSNCFKDAMRHFDKAEKLFSTSEVKDEIDKCNRGIERQNKYEQLLEQANETAKEGDFKTAIDLLIPAVKNFTRQDGEQLLSKLRLVIRARDLYQSGLVAEQEGEIKDAIANYIIALDLLPEYVECKFRLAIMTIKNNPQQAINYLAGIKEIQANYIRGFAYAQLGNWQQAEKEWTSIDSPIIAVQLDILKDLSKRDRLTTIREIEQLIDREEWEIAESISLNFIKQYDLDSVIKHNLEKCIQPILESKIWDNQNWQEIAHKLEQTWLEKQDIKSLHNWAISTYYQAQINPSKLTGFITAWSTALANIELNPTLKDIPWLGSNSIDIKDVFNKLKQILENAINTVKDRDIEEYLKLRDIYRRDIVMLSLAQKNNCGVKNQTGLLILPNCYQHFQKKLPQTTLPNTLWGALYTDWGTTVAACYEKDVARAIKIKPKQDPSSKVENFAYSFIAYHEGCHYLENLHWRKAIKFLQQAKSEIIIKPNWCDEIDRLCTIQRQHIGEFNEHIEFSKLWYLLIGSQASKTYYVEHQSMQIGIDVDDKKISFQQAIAQLKSLQNIDPDNSVTSDIIRTLEINLELETINHLWQQSKYEEAVVFAKRSHYEKVRFAVAEVCLEIVLEILQSGNLTNEALQSLQKIAQWAYELCPQEPLFQTTYSQLRQLGLHH